MLLENTVEFCDRAFQAYGNSCGREKCNHPAGTCSKNCYDCLHQVHYPARFKDTKAKLVYDCPKMLYHYICQYSYLYTTELLCAFNEEKDFLLDFPYFHIVSLGCGGCADLMAFEYFYTQNNLNAQVSYFGVDVNALWRPIHQQMQQYCSEHSMQYKIRYQDVFQYFEEKSIMNANVIVISYLISYLYNTEQIEAFDSFLSLLVNKAIAKKNPGEKLLLVVNDVNSYNRGRNYFSHIKSRITAAGLEVIEQKYRHFDPGNLFDGQRIGEAYSTRKCTFNIPKHIAHTYHAESNCKQTIQLLLEVR